MTSLVSVDQFRQVLGYHPYHFWGLINSTIPVTSACNTLLYEYNWQNTDALGREAIREALDNAENKLRDYLGYSIAPKYFKETVQWPRFYNPTLVRMSNGDSTGRYISQRLSNGYVQAMGYEQLTLIGEAAITYSDSDSDGLDDKFSVSIATSVTDPDKIAVYFVAADRLNGEGVSDKWRINPVSVSISGGTVTITGRSWLLVRPILYEGVTVKDNPIDPDVAGNFASHLAIYNRTTNPDGETIYNAQASLIWETEPSHGWWCHCGCSNGNTTPADSTYDPAAVSIAIGRVGIRDSATSTVTAMTALRNATTGIWSQTPFNWREPDRVEFRYLAGYPLEHNREATGDSVPAQNGQVDKKWVTAVCRMAAAELPDRLCACDRANSELYKWQFDLSRAAGANDEQYATSEEILNNPFGTRRGHVYAWHTVKGLRNMIGFATG